MKREAAAEVSQPPAVCNWCGVAIRRASVKDSHGLCLKCYARMLSERGCASWETGTPSKARTMLEASKDWVQALNSFFVRPN